MALHGTVLLRTGLVVALLAPLAAAQRTQPGPGTPPRRLVVVASPLVADPKLPGGDVIFSFRLMPEGEQALAFVEVLAGDRVVAKVWKGVLVGGAPAKKITWNGRDDGGARCPTGAYTLRLSAPGIHPVERRLELVRLGVTEIEAQDSPAEGLDEFQMVYFRKGTTFGFYATPATCEYRSAAALGQVSDLDLDDGEARPVVAVHPLTAIPMLEGADYATSAYNYPLAYVKGASPRLELSFGASATTAGGEPMGVGYPLGDCELRLLCDQDVTRSRAHAVQPGGKALIDLAPLPNEVGRTDRELTLHWQARTVGESDWSDIPGVQKIPLRFYTLLGPPQFKVGAEGTQYAGPWVEVADYVARWKETLGLPITDQKSLTEVFVRGFFGQNGGIPTAIENVIYDAYPLGGDGGATHYLSFPAWEMDLSRLLFFHARGRFVNCSDNMGAATTMLAMMGAKNMRSVRLGPMDLRAIWGIGAPGYTLNLWGSSHGFSYHHIVTDDGAITVSDTCMQLDEDGSPMTLPGTPGWNFHRKWAGPGGYMDLAASNTVTKRLEALPGLQ